MGLLTGEPLPDVSVKQNQVTTTPGFYTDYLNNLAQRGTAAAGQAKFVDATPLQQQAFDLTAQNVGSYQPEMNQAMNLVQQGTATAPSVVDQYMNPYVNDVVNQIGTLGQRNITQNLAPGATSGAVGLGQFGSKRGAEVLGNTIRDAMQDVGARQAGALSAGYQNAITAAQTDLSRKLAGGQLAGALGGLEQQYGLADVNALATMGSQQQQIGQAKENFPLNQLVTESGLLRGYTIPTSVSSSYNGPLPGAYGPSLLQQAAGVGSLLNAPWGTDAQGNKQTISGAIASGLGTLIDKSNNSTSATVGNISGTSGTGAGVPGQNTGTYTDSSGVQYDSMGNPVTPNSDWYNQIQNDYNTWRDLQSSGTTDYTGSDIQGGITNIIG